MTLDACIAAITAPLAIWVVLNGVDDLFIAFAAFYGWLRFKFIPHPETRAPTEYELEATAQRRMAIFVCLYREHRVIRDMIEHNVAAIRYRNHDIFLGVYPNDKLTIAAATEVCARYPNVHLSMTPHPGGTSKADNLNWIFQRMLLYEEEHNVHFDMIVLHDAEDIIHPDDLRWLNYYAQWYDMVQVPVLALPTRPGQFTHGVYCDEFAEFQFRDMPARELLGGFLPSSGVGTGFSRRALESIASRHANQIFDATSLTEDYEAGFRMHQQGYRQKFIRITRRDGTFVATREYFAQTFRKAVIQRSRWVTGIALQSWEKHPLRDALPQVYWLWRDRKAVAGNCFTALTNMICLYGMVTWLIAKIHHTRWGLGAQPAAHWLVHIAYWPLALLALQCVTRIFCSSRIYGWKFASLVPLRMLWANFINICATAKALWTYTSSRVRGVPLRWLKTEHAYPCRAALVSEHRKLGEILVSCGFLREADLASALSSQPAGIRLGEHLISLGKLSEADLYQALSRQHNLPLGKPDPGLISPAATRIIPAHLARAWKVLAFRIVAEELYLASPEIATEALTSSIREYCPLHLRFHLVTPTDFEALAAVYLPLVFAATA